MMSIPLGPLALPAGPLLLLLSTWLGVWIANRMARPGAVPAPPTNRLAGTVLVQAVLVALFAARLTHLALHMEAYRSEPWAWLDFRDGGWNLAAGWVGGLLWLAWQGRGQASWRKALAAGAAGGLVAWSAGMAVLAEVTPRGLPNLVFTDLATGQPVRLHDVAGQRPLVVNLWATWCGPCRREIPVLGAAQASQPGVAFVFVNQGETAETVRNYLERQRHGLSLVLLDPQSRLGPALGSGGLPTTVFFDRQGQRIDAHMGALNAAALAARLEPLVPR